MLATAIASFFEKEKQIIYLTPQYAAVYAANIDKNKYLKLLETGEKLTVLMTSWGIAKNSTLWQALLDMGKTKVATVAKTIATSAGGWSLVPKLSNSIKSSVESKTSGYKKGLKIMVTWTNKGGKSNSYYSWNQKKNTIVGKKYCRGTFKKSSKVLGWY